MVVFAAPFSQVSGHLLPSQAGDLNPLPVDPGLSREMLSDNWNPASPPILSISGTR
jgi:hypothetical protein